MRNQIGYSEEPRFYQYGPKAGRKETALVVAVKPSLRDAKSMVVCEVCRRLTASKSVLLKADVADEA